MASEDHPLTLEQWENLCHNLRVYWPSAQGAERIIRRIKATVKNGGWADD